MRKLKEETERRGQARVVVVTFLREATVVVVAMLLTATLGDLHAAIHALSAWEATTCTPPTGAASTAAACASS